MISGPFPSNRGADQPDMARFVLAGKADCPFFAKAEYLADKCQKCLPDFSIRKIPILPDEWQSWLQTTCERNGWTWLDGQSPLIWRDVGQGCRGILLGGLSHFLEHCQAYYDVTVDMSSELMLKVSKENMVAMSKQITEEQEHLRSRPLHVWICSALSPVVPILVSEMLQDPEVLPWSPLLSLHLLHLDLGLDQDLNPDQGLNREQIWDQLRALQMETQDLASPRLHQVSVHTDLAEAFTDADLIVFLDDDHDDDNAVDLRRYEEYGRHLETATGSGVRVLLFSRRGVNQKCAALLRSCPTRNRKNFVTVATHLEKHARVSVAKKLHVRTEDVSGVVLWGDVCGHFYVDAQRAQVFNFDRGVTAPIAVGLPLQQIQIRSWCDTELQQVCGQQGALCWAHSVLCTLKAWDSPGTVLSAGVYCSGLLQLPEGLVLSLPVRFSGGSWTLLPDLTVHKKIRDTLLLCCQELNQLEPLQESVSDAGHKE